MEILATLCSSCSCGTPLKLLTCTYLLIHHTSQTVAMRKCSFTRSSGFTYSVKSPPFFSFTVTSLDEDHSLTPAAHLRVTEEEKENRHDLTRDAILFCRHVLRLKRSKINIAARSLSAGTITESRSLKPSTWVYAVNPLSAGQPSSFCSKWNMSEDPITSSEAYRRFRSSVPQRKVSLDYIHRPLNRSAWGRGVCGWRLAYLLHGNSLYCTGSTIVVGFMAP